MTRPEINFTNALALVERESPASSTCKQKELASRLINIAINQNESLERAWSIESYWE